MQIIKGKQHFKVRPFENLRDMLAQSVQLYADQTAFTYRNRPDQPTRSRTYQQFQDDVNKLGAALTALGIKGQHIAFIGENSYAWCLSYFTTCSGLGVAVPLDRLLPAGEIVSLINRGEVKVIFYDPSFEKTLKEQIEQMPDLSLLIRMREPHSSFEPGCNWQKPQAQLNLDEPVWMQLDDLLAFGEKQPQSARDTFAGLEIDPDAMMSLLFTSGTTQASKAVMLSQKNVCSNIQSVAGVISIRPGTRMLSVLPLHHTFENTCGLLTALYVGASIYEADGLRYIQKNMNEYRINMIIGVPALFGNFYSKIRSGLVKSGKEKLVFRMIRITEFLRKLKIDLRSFVYRELQAALGGAFYLGICGAAALDPEIIRFFDAIGIRILEGYGLTETAPVVSGCHSKLFVPGTVGQPLGGVEMAIDALEPGEPGEILVRGKNVMLGYYKDEAATREVLDESGWFRTGDLGRLDPVSRCVSITGRVKSMIVLANGKKVFPEELEHLIGRHEWIRESIVWGEDNHRGDIIVSAKLVIDLERFNEETGQDADETGIRLALEKLIQGINAHLPSFKKIKYFIFSFKELTKTTTLKVKRTIEIEKIRQQLLVNGINWQDVAGKNIDAFTIVND